MKKNIIAMIPARIGSKRLKVKNLAILNNQPLIYYAVEAAKKSAVFNKIVINSDHIIFKKIADRLNVDFYLRPKNLGSSATKSDDVIANFIKNYPIVHCINLTSFFSIQPTFPSKSSISNQAFFTSPILTFNPSFTTNKRIENSSGSENALILF